MTKEEQLLKEGKEVVGQYRSYFLEAEEYSSVKSKKKPNLRRLEKAKEDLRKSLDILAEYTDSEVNDELLTFIVNFKDSVQAIETGVIVLKENKKA